MDSCGGLILLFVFCLGWNCNGFAEAQCPSPYIPVNSRAVNITSDSYTLVCSSGHTFSDGSSEARFTCQSNHWFPDNTILGQRPRCLAPCSPACQNGGVCIQSENFCECKDEFRGQYCQYPASACDVSKLGLTNQVSSCGATYETLDCVISCPDGWEFETKPAAVYSCSYKDGHFSGTPPRCIKQCKNGAKYFDCAPNGQPSCQGTDTVSPGGKCVPDCYCPEGTFKEADKCVPKNECSCVKGNRLVPIGESIQVECNTCICQEGQKFNCTAKDCGAICTIFGDPHYTNFNGIKFNYMGKCSYYLLKTENFTIEGENAALDDQYNYVDRSYPDYENRPSGLKSITIRTELYNITIGQKHVVTVNGKTIVDLPLVLGDIKIRRISSEFTAVEFANGVTVKYDGYWLAYISVPYSFKDKTEGLCGNFGGDNTSEMEDINDFAEKWITDRDCESKPGSGNHPCDDHPEVKAKAERLCSKLKGDVFATCAKTVSPNDAYDNCLYDVCASGDNAVKSFCTSASVYAQECASKGVQLNWRDRIKECSVDCPKGQIFDVCHNPCTQTCADISSNKGCVFMCTPGCNCPDGYSLDEFDRCIPIADCPCFFDGWNFPKGFKRRQGNQACECYGGLWKCTEEPEEVIKELPYCEDHLTLRDFVPVASKTCKNMHEVSLKLPGASCICRPGKVLGDDGVCKLAEECPCYYAGRSYDEGSVIKVQCENCICLKNKWTCLPQKCLGQCSVWGQGHFQTFDDTKFDFKGTCEYVLSAGSEPGRSYQITSQYLRVGAVINLQIIKIKVTVRERTETLVLRRGQSIYPLPRYQEIVIYDSVTQVDIEAIAIGLRIQWDRANGLYIKLEGSWKGIVNGICGDFNGNDDATTGNPTWITGDGCKEPTIKPLECSYERLLTALRRCRILKSELFSTCNTVVDPDNYMAQCINDLCDPCDKSEDNTALCRVLTSYNQECLNRGVLINWRRNDLCPIQCRHNEKLITTGRCPVDSCEDINNSRDLCSIDTDCEACVSSSSNTCSLFSIFASRWSRDCVLRATCKEVCVQLNGVTYYEGDVLEKIGRIVCKCIKGRKVCN